MLVTDVAFRRRTLLASDLVLAEDSALPVHRALGRDHSERDQIVFPYQGAFTWTVGPRRRLIDATSVLFVTGGQDFEETHPLRALGHASLILTPGPGMLDEIGRGGGGASAFAAVTRPMANRSRLAAHSLVSNADLGRLAGEEVALDLVRASVAPERPRPLACPKVVTRAAELLHAQAAERLSLGAVAREVGVSPVYLTQSFTRATGLPLHRYQLRLRMARALVELPGRDCLTELALDLGFSSHSHFTSAFRTAFGLTPSQFRATRRADAARPVSSPARPAPGS